MKVARKNKYSIQTRSKTNQVIIIESDSERLSQEQISSNIQTVKIRNTLLFNARRKNIEKKVEEKKKEESDDDIESIECIDLNSTSRTQRNENESNTYKRMNQMIYKEVFVKNPAYTDKKRLAKDQSTLDPFLKDFRQSKYLKTTQIVNCKYRQTTLQDFKKNQREEQQP